MDLIKMKVKHLTVGLDDLMAQLEEHRPSWWDNTPPFLEQYREIISEKVFMLTEAISGWAAIPPAIKVNAKPAEARTMKDVVELVKPIAVLAMP